MTDICPAAIHLCAVRVTRLDQLGNPEAGPHNVYVTDNAMMLTVQPQILSGDDKQLVGGCDCVIASYRGYDKLKRFNLSLTLGLQEPGLIEMMTGGAAILDGTGPDVIGAWFPNQLDCEQPAQPNVCIEGWQDLWQEDHPLATPFRYQHWIFPSSFWQLGNQTLQNDFNTPVLDGYTRGNPLWGLGIFGDLPEAAQPLGGWFFDDTTPSATCGYQTHAIT